MFAKLIDLITTLYACLFVARWVIDTFFQQQQATGWYLKIKDATEPVLSWVRQLIPPFKGFDFTYIIVIVGIKLIARLLIALFF